jgi:hypothetical protein
MEAPTPALGPSGRRALELEHALVIGAIGMVATGVSSRVTCSSLHFASELLAEAAAIGRGAGVRVSPIWTLDDRPVGIAVERVDDA